MAFIPWISSVAKRMDWYDIALTKWAAVFFTLFILTVWQAARDVLLSVAWYWYLIITVTIMVPLIVRVFR